MKMFAILFLISMSSQIDCHSICEAITPNGIFNGLQIYRKYESFSDSHLVMNNRNGTHWQFNITSDGQFSQNMDVSMATTNDHSLQRFGCVALDMNSADFVNAYQNCMIFAANESHLRLKCQPKDVIGRITLKSGDYVIVPKPHKNYSSVFFFDRKAKDIVFVYESLNRLIQECYPIKDVFCKSKPPPFVIEMDKTLFNSIEGVVDFKSSDEKSYYFILFQINGRPKFCVTSADEPISPQCKSSEKLTNLFEECFHTSVNPNNTLVLVAVVLFVLGLIIWGGVAFMRYRIRETNRQFLDTIRYTTSSSTN